jgi:hypothetical protein
VLVDAFSDNIESTRRKCTYLPVLTNLFLLSGYSANDHISSDHSLKKSKKTAYGSLFEALKKNYKSKSFDISVYCYTEFIRAIAVTSNNDALLRPYLQSFGLEIVEKLLNPLKPVTTSNEGFLSDRLMVELMTVYFQSTDKDVIKTLANTIFDSGSLTYKHYLLSALLVLRRYNVIYINIA